MTAPTPREVRDIIATRFLPLFPDKDAQRVKDVAAWTADDIAALTRRESMDVGRLAFAYIRVRGAHNPTAAELVMDEEVRPCAWCRLAAERAIEAIARLEAADAE